VPVNDTSAVAQWCQAPNTLAGLVPEPAKPTQTDPYPTVAERYSTVLAQLEGAAILAAVTDAGLRGMGGAGFPTGLKWDFVRKQTRTPKAIICNADESEPGTFKDAYILRHLPHLVIEGMALAAKAVDAQQGIIFLRHEYGFERKALEAALAVARQRSVIGVSVGFDVQLVISPGGYILGEETALLECLEDRRGEPRNKPPFPGSHGLHGQPTLINNVETFAHVPRIVRHGAAAWTHLGKPGFSGLKFIAVSGHVTRPGVYEVPMGTTLRELLELAGGMRGGAALHAIMPGGASSNVLPATALDTPLDFAALHKAGSMLGSGAVLFFADGTDMLAVASSITRFFKNESCGKCVPCRVGSEKAVAILDDFRTGSRPAKALDLLPDLASTMAQTSICGLGQVAVAPALSILKQWPELTHPQPSQETS
jgi:NADH:ubiquinone oxidoreductase subunit F (NADH-binding)